MPHPPNLEASCRWWYQSVVCTVPLILFTVVVLVSLATSPTWPRTFLLAACGTLTYMGLRLICHNRIPKSSAAITSKLGGAELSVSEDGKQSSLPLRNAG